jgi:hypothetical protein
MKLCVVTNGGATTVDPAAGQAGVSPAGEEEASLTCVLP